MRNALAFLIVLGFLLWISDRGTAPQNRTDPQPAASKVENLECRWSPSMRSSGAQCPQDVKSPGFATVDDVLKTRDIVKRFAAKRGETSQEFAQRVGSTVSSVESFVYAIHKGGGAHEEALTSLEGFSMAMKNPDKRAFIRCLGVEMPSDMMPAERKPSPLECEAIERRLGIRK